MNEYRWSDIHVGLRHDFEVRLTEDMLPAFSALSGDVNPLHVDPAFALERGYRGVVAFGLLTSSFYSRLVGVELPGRNALLHGVDVEFVSPAFIGDVLRVSGEVVQLVDAYHRIEMRGRIVNQDGKTISRAKIHVGLHVA